MEEKITISLLSDHMPRNSDWVTTAQELYKIKGMRKELTRQEAILQNRLKKRSDGHSSKGGDFAFTCCVVKGKVDYDTVKELEGVDLEPHRKESTFRWKLSKI